MGGHFHRAWGHAVDFTQGVKWGGESVGGLQHLLSPRQAKEFIRSDLYFIHCVFSYRDWQTVKQKQRSLRGRSRATKMKIKVKRLLLLFNYRASYIKGIFFFDSGISAFSTRKTFCETLRHFLRNCKLLVWAVRKRKKNKQKKNKLRNTQSGSFCQQGWEEWALAWACEL